MGFSRQEYWSGLPCPSPGDLPGPVIKSGSPALQAVSLPSEPPGKPISPSYDVKFKMAPLRTTFSKSLLSGSPELTLKRCEAAQCLLKGAWPRTSGNKSDLGSESSRALLPGPGAPSCPQQPFAGGGGHIPRPEGVLDVQRQGQFPAPPLPEPPGFSPGSWSLARSVEC